MEYIKQPVSIILWAIFLCNVSIAAPSPLAKRISLSAQGISVQNALKQVETRAGIKLMYNSQLLSDKPPVTASFNDISVRRALQLIINDGNIIFYELDKYIVIAQRRDVPQGVLFQKAIASASAPTMLNAINDTLHIYDTVQVIDSVRTSVTETLRIYDTVRVEIPKMKETAKKKSTRTAICADVMPAYHTTLGSSQSIGQLSFGGQALVVWRQKHLDIGAGLGILMQRGAMQRYYQRETVDSVLYNANKAVTHKYETGRYYYVNELGETVTQILYDSVAVTVPYQWYNRIETSETVSQTVRHQILWLSTPIRMSIHTEAGKKTDLGINFTVSPTLSVLRSGQILLSDESLIAADKQSIASYALFASIAPSISYRFNKQSQAYIMPSLQIAASSYATGQQYISLLAGVSVGTLFSIGK